MVFWFTGLSGAGKTTLASALATELREEGHAALLLDGDEARKGLCSELGFSMEDRAENIRRIASCARLAEDSGIIACVACISPLAEHRAIARAICDDFREIYIKTDIETCRIRDPKGNYKKGIPNYTGITSRYEPPEHPDLVVDTAKEGISESVEILKKFVSANGIGQK